MLLKIFARNVYFGGYLKEPWHAFIVYMFRWRPEVLHSVGDNALISGFGKRPIQTSNMRRSLVGNKLIDPSDVVGASPVGAASTISSLLT